MPKTFVIDACLAVDAGSKDPPAQRGSQVRGFLDALLDKGHRAGFTADLETEWKDHAARFARRWLIAMRSRRRVDRLSPAPKLLLRRRALDTAVNDGAHDAMEKDWHLVEAAIATDRTIASSDDAARTLYAFAAVSIAALKSIVWVNPATRNLKRWVEKDAPHDLDKRLG
jgi:hypothetical protein